MRMFFFLCSLSAFLFACSAREDVPRLGPLAKGFSEAWLSAPGDLNLQIHTEMDWNQERMLFTLKNVSAKDVELDASTMPWNNSDLFIVAAVASDGKVVEQPKEPPPVMISRLSVPPSPVTLASGASMSANMELKLMPIVRGFSRDDDLLLVWSYRELKKWNSEDHYVLSGITLLNTEATMPHGVTAPPLSSGLSGTSVHQ